MSRIGKMPITLTDKVEVKINWRDIEVKWPKWSLSLTINEAVKVEKNDNSLIVISNSAFENSNALWWTTRSLLNNMIIWVSEWFKKSLEINWVWYKFEVQWTKLVLSVGFSHKVEMESPKWISLEIDAKQKNVLHISWTDKQAIWEFASKIREVKKPEPYKGKWIKYVWEHIRRKAWKSGK